MKKEDIFVGKYYQISLVVIVVILILFGLATLQKRNRSGADAGGGHLPEIIYGL